MIWLLALASAALAVAMTLSPVGVAATVTLVLIVFAARRGLTGAERTAVTWVLVMAIALRIAAIAALFVVSRPGHLISFPFDGDGWFMKQRAIWIRNVWIGVPVTPDQFAVAFAPYGWTSYIQVIAYLQYLLSPAPYAIHLFNVISYVAVGVLLQRLVRRYYGSSAALLALIAILFMPTSFMWSVSALKESLYLLTIALVPIAALWVTRGAGVAAKMAGVALVVAAAGVLNTIRPGSGLIVGAALALASVGAFVTRRAPLLLLTILLIPVAGYTLLNRPVVQNTLITNLRYSGALHIGNVHTIGHGYKLLDQRFYADDEAMGSMTWPESERFALRALYSFVVVPLPWQLASRAELMFLPEQLAWYLLVPFAIVGVVEGFRRDITVTWLFLGIIAAVTAAVAPNEGNIGTMVRHRDGIVPFVACLSALGVASLLSRMGLFDAIRRREIGRATGTLSAARPHFVDRVAASSRVGRLLAPLAAGSIICAGLHALVRRPVVGYADSRPDADASIDGVLERIAGSSVLVAAVGRVLRPLARAWRTSFASAAVDRVGQLRPAERLRVSGWILLVATLAVAVLAPFGDPARPALFAWAAMLVVALTLITFATPLDRAWRERGAAAA